MSEATSHPATAPLPLPALLSRPRGAEARPATRRTKPATLCVRLWPTALRMRHEAMVITTTRCLRLPEVILVARLPLPAPTIMLWVAHGARTAFVLGLYRPGIAFARRIHRATAALWLPLGLSTVLSIHGRTAKSITPTLFAPPVFSIGGIHRATRRIALWLSPLVARTTRVWAALRLAHAVRLGSIGFPAPLRPGLVTLWGSIRSGCCGERLGCGWRLICGLGFLSNQGGDAECERPTKPRDLVGFEVHDRVLFGLTAKGETLVGIESCAPPDSDGKHPPGNHS